jgi:hypothetical protein
VVLLELALHPSVASLDLVALDHGFRIWRRRIIAARLLAMSVSIFTHISSNLDCSSAAPVLSANYFGQKICQSFQTRGQAGSNTKQGRLGYRRSTQVFRL